MSFNEPHTPYGNLRTSYPYTTQSVTGSNDDILTLNEIKEWLRIDVADTSEDSVLTMIRNGVVAFAEGFTGLTFLTTEFKTTRDQFNHWWFELRKYPYVSLTSFQYFVDNTLTTVPTTTYYEETTEDYTNLRISDGQTWPTNEDARLAGIEIVFTAGLGGGLVPADLKIGMLNHIASWYEKRGDCDDCSCESSLPSASKQTYGQHKLILFGKPSNEQAQLPSRLY